MTGDQFAALQTTVQAIRENVAGSDDWLDRAAAAWLAKRLVAYANSPVASCVPR